MDWEFPYLKEGPAVKLKTHDGYPVVQINRPASISDIQHNWTEILEPAL